MYILIPYTCMHEHSDLHIIFSFLAYGLSALTIGRNFFPILFGSSSKLLIILFVKKKKIFVIFREILSSKHPVMLITIIMKNP